MKNELKHLMNEEEIGLMRLLAERDTRIAELEAENAALRGAADSVLADAITHGYEPGDCPDWFDGMISCDSLRKLWLIFYPEDGDE